MIGTPCQNFTYRRSWRAFGTACRDSSRQHGISLGQEETNRRTFRRSAGTPPMRKFFIKGRREELNREGAPGETLPSYLPILACRRLQASACNFRSSCHDHRFR
ncbi:hypothetical protein OBBRIDRAFT_56372 [Obba rivulosa]|uniref:Uncharacterized protein n=1 Tax=Obba rivulosa TaxID=1052685 RepID=A0A8E2AV91_9APHY|nr:hypothetical protein OBBRIDRAFT_56372 [Obba rivulosa]